MPQRRAWPCRAEHPSFGFIIVGCGPGATPDTLVGLAHCRRAAAAASHSRRLRLLLPMPPALPTCLAPQLYSTALLFVRRTAACGAPSGSVCMARRGACRRQPPSELVWNNASAMHGWGRPCNAATPCNRATFACSKHTIHLNRHPLTSLHAEPPSPLAQSAQARRRVEGAVCVAPRHAARSRPLAQALSVRGAGLR